MEQADRPLDVVQRWMLAVITHPDGVEAGLESDVAQRAIPVKPGHAEEMICRSLSQSSLERLAVYSNAYQARLLEVMVGEYPALHHAVGEDAFLSLAAEYLMTHPSSSPTLADLGRSFPDFLARTRPPRDTEGNAPDWADFLIDLARLERTYSEVFDGPGIENIPAMKPVQLSALSLERWSRTRLIPAPCLRLMTFQFPVHEYASAIRRHMEPGSINVQQTWLAITRRDYVVRRAPLDESEYRILSDIVAGNSIETVLQAAMKTHRGPPSELAEQLNVWFRSWSAAGYFTGIAP